MIAIDDISDALHERVTKTLDVLLFRYRDGESTTENDKFTFHKVFSMHNTNSLQSVPVSKINSFIMQLDESLRQFEYSCRHVTEVVVVGPTETVQTCFLNKRDHIHYCWEIIVSLVYVGD